MRRYDLISTIFFSLLGIYVIASGFRIGFGDWHEPGPGFIAVLAGCLLLFLSGWWLVLTLLRKRATEAGKRFFKESGSCKRVLYTLFALAGFTLLLTRAGFMIAAPLFMVFLLRSVEPQRWRTALILSLIVTIFSVVVFQIWLQVQFPEGPLSVYTIMRWLR